MPTAVITESSENTASSTTICATIGQKPASRRAPRWPLRPRLEAVVDLGGGLDQQEQRRRR